MRSTATLDAMVQMPFLRESSSLMLTLQSHETMPRMYSQLPPLRPINSSPPAKAEDGTNIVVAAVMMNAAMLNASIL